MWHLLHVEVGRKGHVEFGDVVTSWGDSRILRRGSATLIKKGDCEVFEDAWQDATYIIGPGSRQDDISLRVKPHVPSLPQLIKRNGSAESI